MSKIYITGFNGYLGSALCPLLSNYEVIKIGNPEKKYKEKTILYDLPKKVERNSTCIHLASFSGEESEANKIKTYKTNVTFTKKICELGFEKIYFISSSSIYGNSDRPFEEDSNLNPTSYYSETKILSEEIVKKSKKNTILRMAVLMGISPHTNWKMFINSIVRNAYENKESQIFAPNCFRPYINVNDAALGLTKLIKNREICGTFNFGFSDMNFNKNQVINEIKKKIPNSKFIMSKNLDNPKYLVSKRSYKLNCNKIQKIIEKKKDLALTIKEITNVF